MSAAAEALAEQARDLGLALRAEGRLAEALVALQQAARLAPARADIARTHRETRHAHALSLLEGGRRAEGEALLAALVAAHPGDEQAVRNLARLHFAEGRFGEGAALLAGLLACRDDLSSAQLAELAGLLVAAGVAGPAEMAARRALAGDAASADRWVTLGLALHQQDRLAEALAAYEQALARDGGHVAARCDAAMVHLARGELARGFAGFERRRGDAPALPSPASLAGRRVVLAGEQGHGDTLHFARYATLVAARGAEVTLHVQPALVRLLAGVAGAAHCIASTRPAPEADMTLPLASLPALFATTLASIPAEVPYVAADPAAVARWRARLAGLRGMRVGVAWAGEPRRGLADRAMDARRSLPLAALAKLAAMPGVTLVSLQKGPGAAQRPPAGMVLHDWTAELDDFADTAALMAALDLVVTVDTSVVHLAGALGRPVWLLNRFDADWRWLRGRDDSPWYPTLRQFRQDAPGDWAGVVDRVAAALAAGEAR
ncbi:MAG: tetratricopeptide repeat protein [Acetobacteraceae bacterium]|nr:tetratricopeptide repeat protein [Acetobacteraceae bacterium]